MLASMGYSLVAPLLPPMCKEKGISNQTCSYLISILALVQIFVSVCFPVFVEKYGRKRIFF
jgi:cyanate permease